ncbi:MAG: porin family protein [Alphaproteobacteria bacterium]|nr:porin family protein [Alphaproteobacteria bacterium]
MNKFLGKAAILAAVSVSAMGLTSTMSMADGFQPYISVFAGGSLANDVNGGDYYNYIPYYGGAQRISGAASLLPPVRNAAKGGSTYYGSIKSNLGYMAGIAMGAKVNDAIRLEMEFSHSGNALDKIVFTTGASTKLNGTLGVTYLLGNMWVDIPTHSAVTPYFGGGIGLGWANITSDQFNATQNGTSFAYQLGGGLGYAVNDHVTLDIGYRFKGLTNAKFDTTNNYFVDGPVTSHNVLVGLRYQF